MRLTLSRRSELALRAVISLARGGVVSGAGLSEELSTSPTYLAGVLSPLIEQGWLSSRPGRNGGYELTGEGRALSVLDVVEAIEGPIDDGHCVLAGGPCPGDDQCALHPAWEQVRAAMTSTLAAVPAIPAGP